MRDIWKKNNLGVIFNASIQCKVPSFQVSDTHSTTFKIFNIFYIKFQFQGSVSNKIVYLFLNGKGLNLE